MVDPRSFECLGGSLSRDSHATDGESPPASSATNFFGDRCSEAAAMLQGFDTDHHFKSA